MKVNIGKYRHHYNTSRAESWWLGFHHGIDGSMVDESMYTNIDYGVISVLDGIQWILNQTINRFNEWRGYQKIRVHVDPWDTWSADHTLANVILPVLEQLRDTNNGYFLVEPKDVPRELKPTKQELDQYYETFETDSKAYDRYEWVMNEMIFAFQCKVDDDWEDEFFHFGEDMLDVRLVDPEGLKAKHDRIQRGFELFGKYYSSLWD